MELAKVPVKQFDIMYKRYKRRFIAVPDVIFSPDPARVILTLSHY